MYLVPPHPLLALLPRSSRFIAPLLVTLCIAGNAIAATTTATVVDGSGAPVVDAVVYALPLPGTALPARVARQAAIEQINREFVAHVTVVQTGTTINFPNRDPLLHHVYSFSPVKSFEIKLYSGDAPRGILFDKPGEVTLGCNIHDWMLGYVFVVDTPFFAKTNQAGVARLGDMTAGDFELRVWHPRQRGNVPPRPVKLDAKSSITLDFAINVAPRNTQFKPPAAPIQYR